MLPLSHLFPIKSIPMAQAAHYLSLYPSAQRVDDIRTHSIYVCLSKPLKHVSTKRIHLHFPFNFQDNHLTNYPLSYFIDERTWGSKRCPDWSRKNWWCPLEASPAMIPSWVSFLHLKPGGIIYKDIGHVASLQIFSLVVTGWDWFFFSSLNQRLKATSRANWK